MGRKIKNNMAEVGLAFAMGALAAGGVIGGAGSINYSLSGDGGVLYIITGIIAIADAVIAAIAFYNRFLKPSDS